MSDINLPIGTVMVTSGASPSNDPHRDCLERRQQAVETLAAAFIAKDTVSSALPHKAEGAFVQTIQASVQKLGL